MRAFLTRLFGSNATRPRAIRTSGRPPSPNGASSLHLFWEEVPSRMTAVQATVRVVTPPATNDLYFFALQTSFTAAGGPSGGGHIGLQWNRRHPNTTAVNWGGYAAAEQGGNVLDGTESPLPSLPNDPNTRDYPWQSGVGYQLTIEPGREPGWWRGSIENGASGERVTIRELHGGGDALASPVVWAEVFAPCDASSVTVEWTELRYQVGGSWRTIDMVSTNYQEYAAGGCTNTNSSATARGWAQTTNTARTTPNRGRLRRGDV